jgi:translation initiation factor 3 subunit L
MIDSEGPVPLDLPEQWLWDIIDEFIYQYQSFCVWRSKVKSKTEEELNMLADGAQVSAVLCNATALRPFLFLIS